jgi:hypothetical protein
MRREQRKNPRRPIRYNAWVVLGHRKRRLRCIVHDVSVGGARLEITKAEELPDAFMLMLTGSGEASRWCRAVWRTSDQIGVHFEIMSREDAARVLLHEQPSDIAVNA